MKKFSAVFFLLFGVSLSANADIWQWTDAKGAVHFVNTLTPIYTWLDEDGRVWYSDTPDHEDAVSVELVWHSAGDSVEEAESEHVVQKQKGDTWAWEGETEAERFERMQAESYYCKRAQDIYDSYLQAPRLYKTTDSGERVYLTEDEAQVTLAETKARVDELCNL